MDSRTLSQTGQGTVRKPFFAWIFPRIAAQGMKRGQERHRRVLLAGLRGRVVEVGAGHGANFALYPPSVEEVVAIEPEESLRAAAARAAADVPISVGPGIAEELPFPDSSFDAAVASEVLCSVDDPQSALAELKRVLRPGGELRFYEHVRSDRATFARLQDLSVPVWEWLGGGCHPNRETLGAIRAAGFAIENVERFEFATSPLTRIATPRILGRARKPAVASTSGATRGASFSTVNAEQHPQEGRWIR